MTFSRTTLDMPKVAYERIHWAIRPMRKDDDAAYRDLAEDSPELGLVSVQVTYKEDQSPFEILTRVQGQQVFVAEVPPDMENAGAVVGSGACNPQMIWFHGKPAQSVRLHSLLVHPDYRHRGIATALIQKRIQWARETFGNDVIIFAELQQDDMAAFKAAAKWATDFTQPRESGFLKTLAHHPANLHHYDTREAQESDYPAIIDGLNNFNHDVDFSRVVDNDRLHRNLSPLSGYVFRHRYVVLDKGEIVGGAVLSEHDPSLVTRMIKAPMMNRVVARLSGMIHEDGEIRGGEVDGIWYKPGHANAAHYLVHELLYKAKLAEEKTEALNFRISNPKVWEAVQISHWQPHTILCVAYLLPPTFEVEQRL